MKVTLLAHTQISSEFFELMVDKLGVRGSLKMAEAASDGDLVALTAIRTCYSHKKPTEIVASEGDKYFGDRGSEANRLFNHIAKSGHTSTLEHISFTFAVEGVSRALLAQLTRHRVGWSYSVQSQRYVKLSSESRSGGFDYVVPESVKDLSKDVGEYFAQAMVAAQEWYDLLVYLGVPQEDARSVLPNAVATNLVVSCNLRALIDFVGKRDRSKGAQGEIVALANVMADKVRTVEPRLAQFLGGGDDA